MLFFHGTAFLSLRSGRFTRQHANRYIFFAFKMLVFSVLIDDMVVVVAVWMITMVMMALITMMVMMVPTDDDGGSGYEDADDDHDDVLVLMVLPMMTIISLRLKNDKLCINLYMYCFARKMFEKLTRQDSSRV